jgi:hypothetical protein
MRAAFAWVRARPWRYQVEVPRRPGERRRQLRDGGFASRGNAADQLDRARQPLDLAGRDRTSASRSPDCSGCPSAPGSRRPTPILGPDTSSCLARRSRATRSSSANGTTPNSSQPPRRRRRQRYGQVHASGGSAFGRPDLPLGARYGALLTTGCRSTCRVEPMGGNRVAAG